MPDADDDRRIADAFDAFRSNVAPCIRPAGVGAVRDTVRRRRVAAVTTAVLLVFAAPAIAYAAIGDPQQVTPPPGATSAPPATPTPSPSLGTPPPSSSPPAGDDDVELPPVPGTVFYLDRAGRLHADGRRYPGGDVTSVNVSPDGTRVTWVDSMSDGSGDLLMSDLDGGNRRTLHFKVDGHCVEPVWSGDSARLLFASPPPPDASRVGILYLAGGAGDDLGEPLGCHYRWSADGRRIAYLYGGPNGVKVSDLGGGRTRTLDRDVLGEDRVFTDLVAISADGGRVCVSTVAAGEPQGDIARDLNCDTVLDVARRKVVDLPIDGELRAVLFTPDGGLLARVDTGPGSELVLLDADDRVVARTIESPAEAGRSLLSYTP